MSTDDVATEDLFDTLIAAGHNVFGWRGDRLALKGYADAIGFDPKTQQPVFECPCSSSPTICDDCIDFERQGGTL